MRTEKLINKNCLQMTYLLGKKPKGSYYFTQGTISEVPKDP